MILAVGLASCAQEKRLPESHSGTPRHRGAWVAFLGKRWVPPGVKWQSQDWSKSSWSSSPCHRVHVYLQKVNAGSKGLGLRWCLQRGNKTHPHVQDRHGGLLPSCSKGNTKGLFTGLHKPCSSSPQAGVFPDASYPWVLRLNSL